MFSHDWAVAKSIIQRVREANPDAIVICGGEHVTAVPEFCLSDCSAIDICVLGEGEETILELMQAMMSNTPFGEVKGIVYRSGGEAVSTGARTRIAALDELPWPAWDLLPMENYLSNGLGYGVNPGRTVPLQVARGCPYQCTFCSSPRMWTNRWNVRNVDEVIREMEYNIETYGAQNFDWYDLTSIVKKDWIIEFCQKLIAKYLGITWQMPSGNRSEALDTEVLKLMYKSGQRNILHAPESGSPDMLLDIRKKISLDNMMASIKSALKEGLNVILNLIMGLPNENRNSSARIRYPGPPDEIMNKFISYEGRDLEAMAVLSRYYNWIRDMFSPFMKGHGVEFGAGQGMISEILLPHFDKLDLIEPSANLFGVLQRNFGVDGRVTLLGSTLEEHLKIAPPASRDVAILVNVLEHIEDDERALTEIMNILKPGGYLLLFVPALKLLYSEFDRLVGHYRRYHRDELGLLVSGAGFEIISKRYCDVLGVLPWLILNRMFGSTRMSPRLAAIYDFLGIPLTRLLEQLMPMPFGKNIILVARRPFD